MTQFGKGYSGSPVGAVYYSIIKPKYRSGQPQSPTTPKDISFCQRMTTSSASRHHYHHSHTTAASTSSLSDSAVFYKVDSSQGGHTTEHNDDEYEYHRDTNNQVQYRVRKRDKVKMVGHNLHSAFKSWFKDVS
jgi:hypothetical protein